MLYLVSIFAQGRNFQSSFKKLLSISVMLLITVQIFAQYQSTKIYGGKGGSEGSFTLPNPNSRITRVNIRHGSLIDALEITYAQRIYNRRISPVSIRTVRFGGKGGKLSSFVLQGGEYITRIKGRSDRYVNQLTFYTNKNRKFGPYGGNGGKAFEVKTPGGLKGIKVRFGSLIDAIGFYFRKPSHPSNEGVDTTKIPIGSVLDALNGHLADVEVRLDKKESYVKNDKTAFYHSFKIPSFNTKGIARTWTYYIQDLKTIEKKIWVTYEANQFVLHLRFEGDHTELKGICHGCRLPKRGKDRRAPDGNWESPRQINIFLKPIVKDGLLSLKPLKAEMQGRFNVSSAFNFIEKRAEAKMNEHVPRELNKMLSNEAICRQIGIKLKEIIEESTKNTPYHISGSIKSVNVEGGYLIIRHSSST